MNVEIAQKILNYFEIEEKVISLEQNQTGLINRTFEIKTLYNKFIIQEINKHIFSNYKLICIVFIYSSNIFHFNKLIFLEV